MLLVEQNSRMALRISHRAYALTTGSVALSGTVDGAPDRRPHQGRLPRRRRLRHAVRLLVINPNTTASMTRQDRRRGRARAAVARHRDRRGQSRRRARPSIEGYYDEALSRPRPARRSCGRRRRRRRRRHRLLRRHRPRRRALPHRGAGHRHRRGGLPLRPRCSRTSSRSSRPSPARSRRSSTTSSATASRRAAPGSAPRTSRSSTSRRAIPAARARIARRDRSRHRRGPRRGDRARLRRHDRPRGVPRRRVRPPGPRRRRLRRGALRSHCPPRAYHQPPWWLRAANSEGGIPIS